MSLSRKFAPFLVVSALVGASILTFLSPASSAWSESAPHLSGNMTTAQCESREVEADEGYGVSHRVIREYCR